MTDDAVTSPADPPAPRAAARLAARFSVPGPPPAPRDGSEDRPTLETAADADLAVPAAATDSPEAEDAAAPVVANSSVAAPWPEGSGEHFVLPDAVPPEGLANDGKLTDLDPEAMAAVLRGRSSALVPPNVTLADDARSSAENDQPAGGESTEATQATEASGANETDAASAGLHEANTEADPNIGAARGRPVVGRPPVGRRGSPLLYAAMALVALAVPLLGWTGFHLLSTSKNGMIITRHRGAADPGYRALVDTTPTALVVQRGANGVPVSLTLLSLGGSEQHGGTAVQIPLQTVLATPLPGVTTISDGYTTGGIEGLITAASRVLSVGTTETIEVDDARLAALVAPVAPLHFRSPSAVTLPDGRLLGAGPVELAAADVGPYLAARSGTETDLDRLTRNQVVWEAWFEAVRTSKLTASVPGEARSGMGRYVRGLAAGEVVQVTLPVNAVDGTMTWRPDPVLTRLLITQAVPFPVSAAEGQRVLVRVLSGVPGTAVPDGVLHRLVFAGAQISELGNGRDTARATTTIQYVDPLQKDTVDLMLKYLGTGDAQLVPDTGDSIGVTVLVGKDLLNNPPGPLTAKELGR